MGYSKAQYEQAMRTLTERRIAAESEAETLRARAAARDPRVAQIDAALAQSVNRVAQVVLHGMAGGGGINPQEQLAALQAENQALQRELAERLHAMGERADNFDPRPTCPLCGDTGYKDGRMCRCLESLLRQQACLELSALSHMTLTTFDSMDMSFYPAEPGADGVSPRARMADILAYCRAWAADFSLASPNLLLRGPAGTGKTHLSLAIASEVAANGHQVVYGSVQRLLRQMEKEHFGREEGDSAERLEGCDLLILDDLGTEFASAFYTSALYELINTRLLDGRPTVISTNLGLSQLEERYGVQIASRITGCYTPLLCMGQDIRQQKLMRRVQGGA